MQTTTHCSSLTISLTEPEILCLPECLIDERRTTRNPFLIFTFRLKNLDKYLKATVNETSFVRVFSQVNTKEG